MEVSSSSSSIQPPVLPPPPLRNQRMTGSSLPASASPLQQFRVPGGLTVRCSPSHGAITRNLLSYKMAQFHNQGSQSSLCFNTGKNIFVSWRHSLRKEFNQQGPDHELYKRDSPAGHTVVRSELVGSGMADAAHPTPEVKISSKVRGILFYAVTSIAAIFLIVPMLLQHPVVLLMDRYRRKAHYFVAKIWAAMAVTPFLKIEFEGLENLPTADTPAVYVSNHQSFLDIYTLLTLGRSFKFISKTSIFRYPIIGWAMTMLGVIPLKRMDSRSQVDCLKRCIELVKKGSSVFFFPEGTRSKDGRLGAFKKGAFSIATKTGAPVVPLALIGTGSIMPTGMESILNTGSVKVVVLKPIEGNNPEVLCSEARKAIADALDRQG